MFINVKSIKTLRLLILMRTLGIQRILWVPRRSSTHKIRPVMKRPSILKSMPQQFFITTQRSFWTGIKITQGNARSIWEALHNIEQLTILASSIPVHQWMRRRPQHPSRGVVRVDQLNISQLRCFDGRMQHAFAHEQRFIDWRRSKLMKRRLFDRILRQDQ